MFALALLACGGKTTEADGVTSRVEALEAAVAAAEQRAAEAEDRLSALESSDTFADLDARVDALESATRVVVTAHEVDCGVAYQTVNYGADGAQGRFCILATGVDAADPPFTVRVQSIIDNAATYPDDWYTLFGNDVGHTFHDYPLYNRGDAYITDAGRLLAPYGGVWRVVIVHDRTYDAP